MKTESTKMTEQEFCVVTRKKWLARKSLNKRHPQYKNTAENVLQEVDIAKFLRRLQTVRDQMEASDYFQQSLSLLKECLEKLGNEQFSQMVCFGIGPFTRSIQAFHQFGFILELQKHLQITDGIFYDPVFRNAEKEVLQTLQCSIMKENCEAKYPAERLTLFYLPHCPNSLTNNLLWQNWNPEMLSRVVLVNNSFKSLSTSKPDRLLRLDSGYILDVLPYTDEFPLDDCYETHNVFNDLSVHIFPESKLPEKQATLWTPKEAPKYEDGEMVVANGLDGLSLTENSVQ